MDYIFSDYEYRLILNKAKSKGINTIFVMTPSIFHLHEFRNKIVFFHDWLQTMQYFRFRLRQKLKLLLFPKSMETGEQIWSYKRTYRHFTRIFTTLGYQLQRKRFFLNSNGSYHLFLFQDNKY